MKNFKRCSLPFLFLLATQGCIYLQEGEFSDATFDREVSEGEVSKASSQLNQGGMKSYGGDIFNLTHNVSSHWIILPSYNENKNGGFILHLDGYNGNLVVAKTNVEGTSGFEKINKLVLSLGGLNNKEVEVQLKIKDEVVRENTYVVKNQEQNYELFIGGIDLVQDFEVCIKLKEGVSYSGDLVIRDIHFSAALLDGKETPYVYDDEKELSLIRDSERHWEINHKRENKYDNKLVFNVKEEDSDSLFAKTTVIGSDKLKKFKALVFEAKTINNNTNNYYVKLVIGEEKHIINLRYNYTLSEVISLENIDTSKDFDIYFYPSAGENRDMTVEISNIILTPYQTAPLIGDGTLPTFNAMTNGFYHWSLAKDSGEELIFHEDGSFEIDTKVDSSSSLRILNSFTGLQTGDYSRAVIRLKGPAGNIIKVSPVFSTEYYSYYSDYYKNIELTGEEQEVEINFNEYRVAGFSLFPCDDANNQPGKLEVFDINYYEPEDGLNLSRVADKIGGNSIDITKELANYWQGEGENFTVDENGIVTYDLSRGDGSLSVRLRRSHAFDNTRYTKFVLYVLSDDKFSTRSTTSYSTSSGYVEIIPNVVQQIPSALNDNGSYGESNQKLELYKYSPLTPTIKILAAKLEKEKTALTNTDYENVAKEFDDKWIPTVDYSLVGDKAKFVIPNDGLTYFNHVRYRPSQQIKFNQATLQFDALEKPLTLSLKLDSHICSEEQVLPVGATSATFTLTPPGGTWYTYSDYKIGFLIKNENNSNADFRLTSYSLAKV